MTHRVACALTCGLGALAWSASPAWAGSFEPYWHFSGVFHPAVAHFPIALIIVAGAIEVLRMRKRGGAAGDAAYACLIFGTLAAIVTTALGWANADAAGDFNGSLKTVVDLHRWLGVAVAATGVVVTVLAIIARRRREGGAGIVALYRLGLFACAAMVGLVGSYGGKLTHGLDYYGDAYADLKKAVAEEEQPHKTVIAAVDPSNQMPHPVVATPTQPKAADAAQGQETRAATQAVTAPVVNVDTKTPAATDPAVAVTLPATSTASAQAGAMSDAEVRQHVTQIAQIIKDNCIKCHSQEKKKGGYLLDTKTHLFSPGDSDEMPVVPGRSDESLIVKVIEGKGDYADLLMPPRGNVLPAEQVALIRRWIDAGAPWPDDMPGPGGS